MSNKPTRWEYITTIIVLILCIAWAIYEYYKDDTKIPFEPIIAVVTYIILLLGYLRWKKNQKEKESKSKVLIKKSKNVSVGNVKVGNGDFIIGDNNKIEK
jgi:hypothetical protein